MSTVSIAMVTDDTARLNFTVCRQGKLLVAGGKQNVSVLINDSGDLRLALANFAHLKTHDFLGSIRIRFNDIHTYILDSTVWRDLCDALTAFALHMDLRNLLA